MFDLLFDNLGTELIWQVLITGFALIGAVVLAVQLVQRKAVPAAAVPVAAGFAALVVVVMAGLATWGLADREPDLLILGIITHASTRLVGVLTVLPVVAVTLLTTAFVGARDGPRHRAPAVAGAIVVALLVGTVGVGGYVEENVLYPLLRAAVYGVFGAVVVVGLLAGGGEGDVGPEAGGGGAMVFPLLVAVGELSTSALGELLMPLQTRNVPPEKWAAAVDWMYLTVNDEWRWSVAVMGIATVLAGIGAWAASHGGRRGLAVAGAVGWSALGWVLFWAGQLGPEKMKVLSVLCTGELE